MSGNNNSNSGCGTLILIGLGIILYLAFEHPLALIPVILIAVLFFAWLFKK